MLISKYHGCGNDFVIALYQDIMQMDIKDFVVNVCNRHTGIGADGCILVKTDPLEMMFYNCDGTQAPMCGNGIRCFAKYCIDEHIVSQTAFDVKTLAGIKHVLCESLEPFQATVAMGKPDYRLSKIHVEHGMEPLFHYPLRIQGKTYSIFSYFMCTIHTIVFVKHAFTTTHDALGKAICHHPMFKEKTNVNFVEIVDSQTLRMQTYERGVGMTLACGSGACAAALLAYKEKKCRNDITVLLSTGKLRIRIKEDEQVYMSGPAVRTLKGEYFYV